MLAVPHFCEADNRVFDASRLIVRQDEARFGYFGSLCFIASHEIGDIACLISGYRTRLLTSGAVDKKWLLKKSATRTLFPCILTFMFCRISVYLVELGEKA